MIVTIGKVTDMQKEATISKKKSSMSNFRLNLDRVNSDLRDIRSGESNLPKMSRECSGGLTIMRWEECK